MTATLPTCPREDCTASARHYHLTLTGAARPCPDSPRHCEQEHTAAADDENPCYAPRTPQPKPAAVVLPTVKEVRQTMDDAYIWHDAAQDVLDLIAARVPAWKPVEPGTVIKAGTRVREVWPDGDATEWTAAADFPRSPSTSHVFIDPRTVPAEPEDPCVELVAEELHNHGGCEETWPRCSVSTVENYRNDARDLLARIDAVRADS